MSGVLYLGPPWMRMKNISRADGIDSSQLHTNRQNQDHYPKMSIATRILAYRATP